MSNDDDSISNTSNETVSSSASAMGAPFPRNFCFTVMQRHDGSVDLQAIENQIIAMTNIQYYVIGRELAPTTGMPHLHVFIRFMNQRSPAAMKAMYPDAFFKVCDENFDTMIDYVKKGGDWIENGKPPLTQKRRGEKGKTSMEQQLQQAKEDPSKCAAWLQLRCSRNLEEIHQAEKRRKIVSHPDITLKDWQIKINEIAKGPVHDREIHFVIDEKGGGGKSTFSKWLEAEYPGQVFYAEPAKHEDLATSLQNHCNVHGDPKIVIIDVPREFAESNPLPYRIMESCKNGRLQVTKYNSMMIRLDKIPHVFCFSNVAMDPKKLSKDRIKIINI